MNKEEKSYFIGLFATDGSYHEQSRNRGKGQIELAERDVDILEKLHTILPCNTNLRYRTRDTNFKENSTTAILSFYDQEFRREVLSLMEDISSLDFRHYMRGVFDGDGSLGIAADGRPFVSMVIVDDNMKVIYINLIKELTGKTKRVSRNKRDNVYNIAMFSEDAQTLARYFYEDSTIYIERKKKLYEDILNWKRPEGVKKVENVKSWTSEEDDYILSHSVKESMEKLDRTESSIKNRVWRLKSALKKKVQ